MAERRMFAKTIVDSDAFLDMPLSTQALYFHLSMRADDDGFTNNPKKIMRMIGAAPNEFDLLLAKRFLIAFESGVVVIKHWKIHNYIRNDRYKETVHTEEKALLYEKENKAYTLTEQLEIVGIPDDIPEVDAGKVSLGEVSLGKVNLGSSRFAPPTHDEVKAYCDERKNSIDPNRFIDFYESKGWMVGKNKMKSWQAAIRNWESKDAKPVEKTANPKRNSFNNFEQQTEVSDLEKALQRKQEEQRKKRGLV